jgi:hypothetical protein
MGCTPVPEKREGFRTTNRIARPGPPIISDLFGSATVPVASVGVSPTESGVRNRPPILVSFQPYH